jgi:tetratricopeptide (TPR) repeat protein
LDEALRDYDEALLLDPNNRTVIDQRNKTLLTRGDFNRAPGAETEPTSSMPELPLMVKNLVPYQASFMAVKAGTSYKGYRWRGLYEINNQGDTNVTITDFQVLWQPASFEGQQLKLAARLKPTAFSIFDDVDAVIKSADEKEDAAAKKFPISVPPRSTRYVAIYFLFDLFSGGKQPLQFQDEKEAYRLLSGALGWKPNSEGNFNCLFDSITVAVSTAESKGVKFKSLTALIVPGCKVKIPYRSALNPLSAPLPSAASPAPGSRRGAGLLPSLNLRNVVTKGLSVEEYTKIIAQDPDNAQAYNERGKAYLSKREYDRAIQDFDQALRLWPYFSEAKNNLEEAKRAKAKADCGFQLHCNP